MPRRGSSKQFTNKLSAGGANRTSIQGQMDRVNDPEIYEPYRISTSALPRAPRLSSFQPWNSRLFAQQPQESEQYVLQQEPDQFVDDRGRPIPRRGMFLNAKYSEPARPVADEAHIRRTEEMIRRIVQPKRHDRRISYMQDYGLRDRIRQVVYDMGVPPEYRAPSQHDIEDEAVNFETSPQTSQQKNHRRHDEKHNKQIPKGPREESSEEEEEEVPNLTRRISSRRNRHREEKPFFMDPSQPSTSSKRDKNEQIPGKYMEKKQRKRRVESEEEPSDKGRPVSSRSLVNTSHRSVSRGIGDPNSFCDSRTGTASFVSTPQQLTPSPQYIRDPDDDDNWKNALPFISKPNGAGSNIFARIGSAIPSIPLKDNTQNSYSKVALMLLDRSIKNSKLKDKPEENREALHTQLMNMSTSWVRTMNAVIPDEEILEETDSRKTLINEISKIQMPQNATKMQINESLLRNSNLTERKIPDESGRTKKPRSIPPPLFHSSAVSNDVFQSDEGITMPSSIRKIVECTQNDSDEDEPIGRAQDIDDYIARGASQLNFSKTLESLSTSLKQTTPCGSTFSHERSHKGLKTSKKVTPSLNVSKKAVEVIEETPTKWNRSIHQEEKNKTASSSKSKTESYTLQLNSQFLFSAKKKKKEDTSQPMLDFDADTQKMFDAVFSNEEVTDEAEALQKKKKEKYSF